MDNYIKAIGKALANPEVTISVKDSSEFYYDLEFSRNKQEIIEACEATEMPIVEFFENKMSCGQMSVMVGQGEASIIDHHVNEFMDSITNFNEDEPQERETNVELVTRLMEQSKNGALMQMFVIASLSAYSEKIECLSSGDWKNEFIDFDAWQACATEIQEALKKRS